MTRRPIAWNRGIARAGLVAAGLALSACAVPPYDDFRAQAGACMVVQSSGFMVDRPCSSFELAWLPGARRLTVGEGSPDTVQLLEISGRHRWITLRRVGTATWCALSGAYPREHVTRNCRSLGPADPPLVVRG